MGGGAIRTAAKAAALAAYRSTAARRAANMHPTASASTVHVAVEGESSPLISAISSEKPAGHPAMVQFPVWELDEWELAGGKEEDEVAAAMAVSDRMSDQPPRLVFGPAPTLEEAKEATADLKEAIEKVYFSGAVEEPITGNKASDHGEAAAVLSSMPKHVFQAFSLLQGSSEAQSVVASLACDKNVWDAVMKNDKVMEFCYKNPSVLLAAEADFGPKESVEENEKLESSETVESANKEEPSVFTDILQNIKVRVAEMVSNVSSFLQDFMGASPENHGATSTKTSTNSNDNYVDFAMGASFIALAVAAILVVLVKRG